MKIHAELNGLELEIEYYAGSNKSDDPTELSIISMRIVNLEELRKWLAEEKVYCESVDALYERWCELRKPKEKRHER